MEIKEIISPYFENGEFAGARVCVGDEDFVITPNDYNSGEEMTWDDAMDALKVDNLSTWDYRQICLTMAYRDEIDKVLEENGGYSLDNVYWTSAEYLDNYSFIYNGYDGRLDDNRKRNTFSVRAIKNLK